MKIPILVYHSANIAGNEYKDNDHVALASDLRLIHASGFRILPLHELISRWLEDPQTLEKQKIIALTCDDGTDFDFHDLPHPVAGVQRSMLNILRDFRDSFPGAQPGLFITSFVIVSPESRHILAERNLAGKKWFNDSWWPEAVSSGLMGIANHSWDHNHRGLPPGRFSYVPRGTFTTIDTKLSCDLQVGAASARLWAMAPNPSASLFAYPYGESNSYLVKKYFPEHASSINIIAAVSDTPRPLTKSSNRWCIPRYVFGRDWNSPSGLQQILDHAAFGLAQRAWRFARLRANGSNT